MTSGELFYHASRFEHSNKPAYKDISEEFWAFLRIDSHTKWSQHNINDLRKIGEQTCKILKMKLQNEFEGPTRLIDSFKTSLISKISLENSLVSNQLSNMLSEYESQVMQLVLDYFAILKSEVDLNRTKLETNKQDQLVLVNQASVLRDIRLFACHLAVESRGQLGLSMLPLESQQFVRCVKAVVDNVNVSCCNPEICSSVDDLKNLLRVPHVFKLQNSFLAGKLKVHNPLCHMIPVLTIFADSFREGRQRQGQGAVLLLVLGAILQVCCLWVVLAATAGGPQAAVTARHLRCSFQHCVVLLESSPGCAGQPRHRSPRPGERHGAPPGHWR